MVKTLNSKKGDNLSNALYICKAFAVVSIVLAHTYYDKISNVYINTFLSIYKLIGVYIFFILSGYFYNREKYKNVWELLKDKGGKICIPWLFLGTINYIIPVIFNDSFEIGIVSYINYLLGNGSYLYFLTMLFISYIITYFMPKKTEYFLIAINVVSVCLTNLNIFPQLVNEKQIIFTYPNPYLNILNWIGIFALGLLIRRKNWIEKTQELLNNKYIIITLIYLVIWTILCMFKVQITYWNVLTIIIGIISFIAILTISLKLTKCKLLIDIGKKSFSIYLIHLIFLILIGDLFSHSNIFAILRPIVVVLIIYLVFYIGQKLAKMLKLEKLYNTILGIR